MPIFEYKCNGCGKEFEALVFGSEKPDCSACKSSDVEKLMSVCGFVSQGSGGSDAVKKSAGSSSCSGCASTSCGSCGG